eukprot:scaffold19591_cov141-Isochrysis_galbana.AAC.2
MRRTEACTAAATSAALLPLPPAAFVPAASTPGRRCALALHRPRRCGAAGVLVSTHGMPRPGRTHDTNGNVAVWQWRAWRNLKCGLWAYSSGHISRYTMYVT